MNIRRKLAAQLLLLMLISGWQNLASAASVHSHDNRIVGLWDVQVNNFICGTAVSVACFRGLHKFERGGTAQVVPATNPALLSAHMGIWRHVERNKYKLDFKMFRFDANGNNIGWTVVKANVAINENATGYAGSGQAEVFDANGNKVGMSCPAFTGTRFSQ
jgi:hypothetical protein